MMKFKWIICVFICLILNASNEKYFEALKLIISSQEYQSLGANDKDYIVSKEIISFDTFGILFGMDRTQSFELQGSSVSTIPKAELLKINKKKRSKVKIFFSEEKNDIFFAEVFFGNKCQIYKYSEKPSFGSSYIYMFKNEKGKITLLKAGKFYYN